MSTENNEHLSSEVIVWSKQDFLSRFPYFQEYKSFQVRSEGGFTRHPLSFFEDQDFVEFNLDISNLFASSILTSFYSLQLKIFPIGFLIPDNRVEVSVNALRLDTRSYNSLIRNNIHLLSDLIEKPFQDLIEFPNLGQGSINKIMFRLFEISVRGDDFLQVLSETPLRQYEYQIDSEKFKVVKLRHFWISTGVLKATFSIWGQLPLEDYLRNMKKIGIDFDLLEKRFEVNGQELQVLEQDSEHYLSWSSIFSDWSPRQIEIFYRRVVLEGSASLETLGQAFGCTREYVRQIEIQTRNLALVATQKRNETLHVLLHVMLRLITRVKKVSEVWISEPWLTSTFEFTGLKDSFRISLFDFLATSTNELKRIHNLVMPTEIFLLLTELGQVNKNSNRPKMTFYELKELAFDSNTLDEEIHEVLTFFGLRTLCGFVIPVGASLGDQIELMMKASTVPLDVRSLQYGFGNEFSSKYLINLLQADGRFVRIGSGLWALATSFKSSGVHENRQVTGKDNDGNYEVVFPDVVVLKKSNPLD